MWGDLELLNFGVLRFAVWADSKWSKVVDQILKNIHLFWAHIVETKKVRINKKNKDVKK